MFGGSLVGQPAGTLIELGAQDGPDWWAAAGAGKECIALGADGTKIPVEIISRAYGPAGREYVAATFRDRSGEGALKEEIRVLNGQLEAVEDSFLLVLEQAPVPLMMVNFDGRMTHVNPALESMLGYNKGELSGQMVGVLVADNVKSRDEMSRTNFLFSPEVWGMGLDLGKDLHAVRKDGTRFPVKFLLAAVESHGKEYILCSMLDISESIEIRKLKESLVEDLEKKVHERTAAMLDANESLGKTLHELQDFAFAASHDLQGPVRLVTSYSEFLAAGYRGKLDQSGQEYLGQILQSCGKIKTLLDLIVDYFGFTPDRLKVEAIDSGEAFREALELMGLLEKAGGDPAIECSPLPKVRADAQWLSRLFGILLGNALKFNSSATPQIQVDALHKGDDWIFSVKDNGIGIPSDQHLEIFKIFRRLHSEEEYPGVGGGLAIARRIVECHGGEVWVESEPGEGSIFYFTLPSA